MVEVTCAERRERERRSLICILYCVYRNYIGPEENTGWMFHFKRQKGLIIRQDRNITSDLLKMKSQNRSVNVQEVTSSYRVMQVRKLRVLEALGKEVLRWRFMMFFVDTEEVVRRETSGSIPCSRLHYLEINMKQTSVDAQCSSVQCPVFLVAQTRREVASTKSRGTSSVIF